MLYKVDNYMLYYITYFMFQTQIFLVFMEGKYYLLKLNFKNYIIKFPKLKAYSPMYSPADSLPLTSRATY